MVAEQPEKLTRHDRLKADDFARADPHPFGMGSGQAKHAVKVRIIPQNARDLGFFAAHYIGWFCLANTGQDMHRNTRVFWQNNRRCTGLGRMTGRCLIRGLGPDHTCAKYGCDPRWVKMWLDQVK